MISLNNYCIRTHIGPYYALRTTLMGRNMPCRNVREKKIHCTINAQLSLHREKEIGKRIATCTIVLTSKYDKGGKII